MPKPENIVNKGFDKHPENINKEGRPVGSKNRATILKKWIEAAAKIKNEEGLEIVGTVEDKVNLALITQALKGDVNAIKEINDTLYGKIADKSEVKTEADITIKLIKGDRG